MRNSLNVIVVSSALFASLLITMKAASLLIGDEGLVPQLGMAALLAAIFAQIPLWMWVARGGEE